MIRVTKHCVERYMQRVMLICADEVARSIDIPARADAVKRIIRAEVARASRLVPMKHGLWCRGAGVIFCLDHEGAVTTCFPPKPSQLEMLEKLLAA